jgi:acetyl esterase/lipase
LRQIGHFCVALTKAGIAAWCLEYRRIGNEGGGFPGTLEDVRRGASHLEEIAREHSLDTKRVVATGHSAGGHLALWLAKQAAVPLRGVVPLAPVADLRRAWELKLSSNVTEDFLGGSPEKVPERYRAASPVELVPLGVKQRVFHADRDDVVPPTMSAVISRKVISGEKAMVAQVFLKKDAVVVESIIMRSSCKRSLDQRRNGAV